DPDSRTAKLPGYLKMIETPTPIQDGFYDVANNSKKAMVFDLDALDMENVPQWVKLNWDGGIRQILIKDLTHGSKPCYNLILFSDKADNFGTNDIDFIDQMANQIATAASNVAAYEEILRKERDKAFLLEFSQDIASSRTKWELSRAIHGSLKKLSHIQAYFIRVLDGDGRTMSPFMYDEDVFYLKDEKFIRLLKTKIPVDNGITARVIMATGPVIFDLAEEDRLGNSGIYINFWKELGDRKMEFNKIVGVPLRLANKTLGLLWIITRKINTDLLNGLSAQISVVISNVLANEEIVQREHEKTVLLSLSREIAAMKSRKDLLKVFSEQFRELFTFEGFGISIFNDDGLTYSPFIVNSIERVKRQPDYEKVASSNYRIGDPVYRQITASEEPVILNVAEMSQNITATFFLML